VGRDNRRLHSEGLQGIIRVMIWWRIRLVWGGERYARTCRVLVGKPEGKSHLEHLVVDVSIILKWN
jgi:hypothetical protein